MFQGEPGSRVRALVRPVATSALRRAGCRTWVLRVTDRQRAGAAARSLCGRGHVLRARPATGWPCLRGALGAAPTLAGAPSGWLQVGLSSTIELDTFERPPLSLILTADISGSMDWEYRTPYNEYQTPLKLAKLQMEKLVATLGADD